MRVVGFYKDQRDQLAKHNDTPVSLDHCSITKSKFSDFLEVVVNQSMVISASPKKITTVAQQLPVCEHVSLDALHCIDDYKRIKAQAKVIRVDPSIVIKHNLNKQDVYISDATATARLTLWQEQIDTIKLDKSYIFDNLLVKTYMGKKYITPSKGSFISTIIDDIGEVATDISDNTPYTEIVSAQVGGVEKVSKRRTCLACNGEVIPTNAIIGRCTICQMGQRLEMCQPHLSARLLIIHDNTRTTLTAPLPMIHR